MVVHSLFRVGTYHNMKTQYQIQIVRIDNGFLIVANSDDGKRAKLQADSEEKVKELMGDIVSHIFDAPPEKPKA